MKKFILILFLFLISCGARKVAVTNIDVKRDSLSVVTKDTMAVSAIKINDSTNIKVNKEEDEITITPIDTSKEIVYNGRRIKNAVLRIRKVKTNSLYTNVNKVSKNDSIAVKTTNTVAIKDVKKENTKQVDKKEPIVGNIIFFLSMLFLLIVLGVIVRKMYKTYIG
jgi:hypothetical protein